ncbi:MAG TPA: flagellar export protein FliJ [Steroidobacteraceae bacterium]|jgi:flagellar FliJ protein|nr:flagellar export protein FliJ [Steroidobacteraceae bacterium]
MKKTERIGMVRRVVETHERRKAEALAECERNVRAAQAKLDELEAYRAAYVRDFTRRAESGMNGAGVREYQVFLGRLDEALRHQAQILTQGRLQRDAELESWRNAARRATAVGNLATHWQAEERLASEKTEQKETDERSQQLWSRRTLAHGS